MGEQVMGKELIGQNGMIISDSPVVVNPPSGKPVVAGKAFLTDLKGEKGDPGEVDPVAVTQFVENYLIANPPGIHFETFVQSTPETVWVITHSLPFQPAVTIIDSAGTRIETEIVYDSPTQIRSIASAAFAGRAELS